MFPEPDPQKDSASAVRPPMHTRLPWRVAHARALPNFRLHVRFVDGLEGTVEMASLVQSPNAGVFAPLADQSRFVQVFVEHGAVTWPREIDLAPDAMYTEIKKAGKWVLA